MHPLCQGAGPGVVWPVGSADDWDMSADNYYLIVPNPAGGFSPVMRFASDDDLSEDEDTVAPAPMLDEGAPVFATPEEALDSVLGEYAEYGHAISGACYSDLPVPQVTPTA